VLAFRRQVRRRYSFTILRLFIDSFSITFLDQLAGFAGYLTFLIITTTISTTKAFDSLSTIALHSFVRCAIH
jgi:hypothetical protein